MSDLIVDSVAVLWDCHCAALLGVRYPISYLPAKTYLGTLPEWSHIPRTYLALFGWVLEYSQARGPWQSAEENYFFAGRYGGRLKQMGSLSVA